MQSQFDELLIQLCKWARMLRKDAVQLIKSSRTQ